MTFNPDFIRIERPFWDFTTTLKELSYGQATHVEVYRH